MESAGRAIVDAGGGLVATPSGNTYRHRVDVRMPMMMYDPKIERTRLVDVRARFTVET